MQVLPAAGYLLHRLRGAVSPRAGKIAFMLFTAVYLLALIGAFAQAMAGLPLIAMN
jgi:hypothetical protein